MHPTETVIFLLTYNNENTLRRSLDDLLLQTYKDYELFIFDDCSTDATYNICMEYASKNDKIHLFKNEKNLGALDNFIHSLSSIKNNILNSSFFLWACPDDEWENFYLEKCINKLKTTPEAVACQSYINIAYKNLKTSSIQKYKDLNYHDYSLGLARVFNHTNKNEEFLYYNQCIHSLIYSKVFCEIFLLKNNIHVSILTCELAIIGLLIAYGGITIYPETLTTKNIFEQFEKLYPNDKFTIMRNSKLHVIKSCFSILYFLQSKLIKSKNTVFLVFLNSIWFYLLRPPYFKIKIFIYEKLIKRFK